MALWTCIGFAITSRLLPRSLALAAAPLLGWAVHSVLMLPLLCATGMARSTVVALTALSLLIAIAAIISRPRPADDRDAGMTLPLWAIAGAALLALPVMFAVLPKLSSEGVALSAPIFDHSKVAIVDEIARLGVPAGNPFFGEIGGPQRLAYYYLWHFSAAELSVLTGLGGWNADAGLSWFNAFATLMLMMGFAIWLGGRRASAAWVLAIAGSVSIRPLLIALIGERTTYILTGWPTGFGAWLFQVTWAPQHVASAGCIFLAIFLLVRLAQRPGIFPAVIFALLAAAGFESSTWVGGVTFPLAAATIGVVLLIRLPADARWHFAIAVALSAALAITVASPFIVDQLHSSILRGDGRPIAIYPYDVLGDEIPRTIRLILLSPAYWTVFLFVEFAAFYPVGAIMMRRFAVDSRVLQDRKAMVAPFALLTFVSLAIGGYLVSTVADNNDLAWRGVLPGIFALIVFAAAGLARYLRELPRAMAAAAAILVVLGLCYGAAAVDRDIEVKPTPSGLGFVQSVRMWRAVRAHAAPGERVANNPMFLRDMTDWPINISWALLANRASCYAGADLALPFAPLTRQQRQDVDALFTRVFAGDATAADIEQLANRYDCAVIVVTPGDGAWNRDPLASSPLYREVETKADSWRIYRRLSTRAPAAQ